MPIPEASWSRPSGRAGGLDEPVALSLRAVLHFIPDARDPQGMVRTLMDACAPGSLLTLSHVTPDLGPETIERVWAVRTVSDHGCLR